MKYDYDLICIGLGPAGMAVSIMGSEMGLRVCAIEKHKIGGECMNCGCIPSKALLRMAQFRQNVEKLPLMQLAELPLPAPQKELFGKIQGDLKFINEKKTLKMFDKVDLILGEAAEFVDAHTVKAGDRTVTAKRIFIATGTKPQLLPVPGLATIPDLLTNENLFTLDEVPESLIVLGGGAIAAEMAQAFQRLGSKVTMIQRSPHILSKNDPEAAAVVEESLRQEGVDLRTGTTLKSVARVDGGVQVTTDKDEQLTAQRILAATGRSMNFDALKLQHAGVVTGRRGEITVNKHLQTSRKHIYAVGDCNGYYLFSHAAMHQGMIALMNSMMPLKMDFRKFAVPATIFTEPQASFVGLSEKELKEKGIRYETHISRYEDYGAAIAEEVKEGFVKVFCSSLGKIYGAVIVGEGSGEMINEWALAVQKKVRMHEVMMLQHSFPTMGFLSKRVAENWMMAKMKNPVLKAMCKMMF
ncbi:dihydrolipoyl dehydrogenase family protein [Verrucomicrobiota bacterium]